ncbi:MAG: gamma-glutamylcyclotransferase family protein [Microthrixaceae bacterium]
MEPAAPADENSGSHVFAYGSLMFPAVCEAVIGRIPTWRAAHVGGWLASSVPGAPYPALVPDADATTDGLLLGGITEHELAMLDRYEGSDFRRTELLIQPGDMRAWVWVAGDPAIVTGETWDPGAFERQLSEYLGR